MKLYPYNTKKVSHVMSIQDSQPHTLSNDQDQHKKVQLPFQFHFHDNILF